MQALSGSIFCNRKMNVLNKMEITDGYEFLNSSREKKNIREKYYTSVSKAHQLKNYLSESSSLNFSRSSPAVGQFFSPVFLIVSQNWNKRMSKAEWVSFQKLLAASEKFSNNKRVEIFLALMHCKHSLFVYICFKGFSVASQWCRA